MKRITICGFSLAVVLSLAVAASGEQRVVLRSGAVMSGDTSVDGENLVISVTGARLVVPMKDVATVTPVGNTAEMAQRLLLRSLESQLLYGGTESQIGLLAEAYRVAPDDPQVAYWYARALVDAGNGMAAKGVYEARQAAIASAYPGLADRLAQRIEKRLKLESLPAALVKRIDEIEDAAGNEGRNRDDRTLYAAYFQLVDQHDTPIEDSAIQIHSRGESQKLETFPEGYHLLTYYRYGTGEVEPCRMDVDQLGLESATFEFRGSAGEAANAGEFRMRSLAESDRIPVIVTVRDADEKPLDGVTVAFSTRTQLRRQRGMPPWVTDAKGRAEARLLPGPYFCQIVRENYHPITQNVTVEPGRKSPVEIDVTLDRAISARVKVAWRTRTVLPSDDSVGKRESVTTGECELHSGPLGNARYGSGAGGIDGVRLAQFGNVMKLVFMAEQFAPRLSRDAGWVGRVELAADASTDGRTEPPAAAAAKFDGIDLTKLEEIKGNLKLSSSDMSDPAFRSTQLQVPVELGAIYVGKMNGRDQQSGQPAVVEFKMLVTELSAR